MFGISLLTGISFKGSSLAKKTVAIWQSTKIRQQRARVRGGSEVPLLLLQVLM